MTTPATTPPASPPSAIEEPAGSLDSLADAVATAVRSVPGVADLHTGAFGEVATYLPGRRVNGIRLRDDVTEVHVVLTWGAPLLDTADQVRATVAAMVTTPVDVTVEDIVGPPGAAAEPPRI